MSKCLGIYIEEYLIKYAKVSKEHDNIKVETFGVMFYDKISDAIKQIIEETYSQKIPISINISDEMYNYFDMFSLLTKNDLQKAIKTEFDAYCSEKGYNPNVFETRYAIIDNQLDKEKIKMVKTFNANKWQILTKVVLPANISTLFNTLKVNIGLSLVGVISGEFLVSKGGLGYLIVYGGQVFKLDLVMTSVIILAILAALMYEGVELLQKRFLK